MRRRIVEQRRDVEIELRIDGEHDTDHDGDGERDDEPGPVHAHHFQEPALRPANSQ